MGFDDVQESLKTLRVVRTVSGGYLYLQNIPRYKILRIVDDRKDCMVEDEERGEATEGDEGGGDDDGYVGSAARVVRPPSEHLRSIEAEDQSNNGSRVSQLLTRPKSHRAFADTIVAL